MDNSKDKAENHNIHAITYRYRTDTQEVQRVGQPCKVKRTTEQKNQEQTDTSSAECSSSRIRGKFSTLESGRNLDFEALIIISKNLDER